MGLKGITKGEGIERVKATVIFDLEVSDFGYGMI